MSRLANNLIDIFKVINADDELWRLLYYPTDPLNPSKSNVQSLSDFKKKISKSRIMRSPKTDDLTTEPICRLCMYFGNRGKTNSAPYFYFQDIVFDVYVHIDAFDTNDARSLLIVDRLNEILHSQNITGFSKMHSDKMLIIGNPPSGYIGYKCIFEFVSENF